MTEKISTNKIIIAVLLCGMFYAILFALHAAKSIFVGIPILELILNIPGFESPMYVIMPFFGFFAVFVLVDWINEAFETKLGLSPAFPVTFFLLALLAYYVALYWYVANFASLQGIEMSLDLVDFWGRLQVSAYILFLWAGVFGWVARYAIQKINL